MSFDEARRVYAEAEIGRRLTLGSQPAFLVVDFQLGFTDGSISPLGADADAEVAATRRMLDVARPAGLPVIFTAIGFQAAVADNGLWLQKVPNLRTFEIGRREVEIDPRLEPAAGEPMLTKKGASAFFGTNLAALLTTRGVDTVVLCGLSTSGCVRATAVDLLQHGYPTLVPRECVVDRVATAHETSLFDIDAKYADVVSIDDVLAYVARLERTAR